MKSKLPLLVFLICFFILNSPVYSQDADADGVVDDIDVDDDNDGILDVIECIDLGKFPLLNADFEDLDILTLDGGPTDVVGTSGIWKGDASHIPNWESADPINNYLEIWHNTQAAGNDAGGLAYSGIQWAEINASTNDGLYQDITTTPGDVLQWSFAHRKRTGYAGSATEDIARLLIGDPIGPLTSQGDFSSANDASWTVHSGTYTVPAGQTTTRLTFTWVNSVSGSSSSGNFVDNVQLYIIPNCQDTDGDSIPDYLDIDSDNDGIPDNVEAQSTTGYLLPSGTVNPTGTYAGLWNNYGTGLSLENTDGIDEFDYLDSDSDNDGIPDIQENGMANSFAVTDSDSDGLKNDFETTGVNDLVWDANEDIHDPSDLSILPDIDGDLAIGGDLDYRDVIDVYYPSATIDFDGINDYISTPSFMSGYQNATMMAWIKLDATFSATGDIAGHAMMRIYVDSARKLRSYYITNASNSAYGSSVPTNLDVEQWYHVAITYEGATGRAKIYVNGELEAQSTIPSGTLSVNPTYTSHDFNIGRHSRLSNSHFKGHIDEVRVFSEVLTDEQLKRMVYQEIEQNGTDIKGSVLPNNIDENLSDPLLWSELEAYFPMTNILTGKTNDYSSKARNAVLNNITTTQDQTAPMPYETTADGDWTTEATWLHGDVWDIENAATNKDWSIVNIKNDVTTSSSHTNLGLMIDATKTLTVNGDNAITNSWYMKLNGTLDLADDSQLVQGTNSDLVTSATGKILRRQEGHTNIYWYNYWSSPVGSLAATLLTDNNTAANNSNNTPYSLGMLKDGAGTAMQFTTAFDEVGKVSTRWLYAYQNGVTYYDWVALNTSSNITPGLGYTQKGTGNAGIDQQYTFEGKPNNGTILLSATDTGGPGSVESVSKTQYLLGNPYPSAIDAHTFIDDNVGVSSGTLYLWEQWAGSSHWLEAYEGGYATVNKLAKVRAYQFIGIDGAAVGAQNGIKTPTQYLPVGQGFITEIVADGNIEFNNGQRAFKQEGLGESQFFRNGESAARDTETTVTDSTTIKIIRLEFRSSNDLSRELVLGFSNITSDAFDYGYDSTPNEFRDNDLATLLDGQKMVIQAFSQITDDKSVDLVMNSDGNYSHTIRLLETEHIDDSQNIYIHDTQENIHFDIRNGDYEFTSLVGEDTNRFKLVFQTAEQELSVDDLDQSDLTIFVNQVESKLYIKGIDQEAKTMTITNMLGQVVKNFNNLSINEMENGVFLGALSSGVYIMNLVTQDDIKLDKKIILE